MIPFLDLKAQYRGIERELLAAAESALASGQYASGPQVAAFEEEFADFCGARFGVGTSSGTAALHLALRAAEVGPGDEVITVASTFVATVAAIEYTGARPVLVDVDPETLNMDPERIAAALTERTKAILPVHLHGHPADLKPILELAERRNLPVIEDAAQAHGAEYGGRRAGALGHLGCFSFYPGKNLGACGEAGMVVTDSAEYAERLRALRDWGQTEKYRHTYRGFNYRMDGIQGALLRVKLRHLARWTEARRAHAEHYTALLRDAGVVTPVERNGCRHVYHVYGIRTPRRDRLKARLAERGIGTGIHYPIPVHLQEAYRDLGYGPGDLPVTERAAAELLSLPMYPELRPEQVEAVCSAVREDLEAGP